MGEDETGIMDVAEEFFVQIQDQSEQVYPVEEKNQTEDSHHNMILIEDTTSQDGDGDEENSVVVAREKCSTLRAGSSNGSSAVAYTPIA